MTTIPRQGNSLKAVIKQHGYKLYQVADGIRLPLRTLSEYCSGRVYVPREWIGAIASYIGCPVEHLYLVQYQQEESAPGSDDMRRRELLRLLALAGAALMLPPLPVDWERIESALVKPSRVDEAVLHDLQAVNDRYWRIYRGAFSKQSALDGVLGHFRTLVEFLRDSNSPTAHKQLCALTSDIAQLAGEIFFDKKDYNSAQSCYTYATSSAREAGHYDLWACALTRNAYLPIYSEEFQDALPLLQEARRVAQRGDSSLVVRFWCDSVIAEARAGLHDLPGCQQALDSAEGVRDYQIDTSPAWLRFESSRLPGLRGSCFVRLEQPEAALSALQEALVLLPDPIRRRAMTLTDIATAYAQQGEIERACNTAEQAIDIAVLGNSMMLKQGLHRFRNQLGPFADASAVQAFDRHMTVLM
jgi:tetratricopeptide (TPR) repeat protein